MTTRPAVLGAGPTPAEVIPMARPTLQVDQELWAEFRDVLSSGMLTNGANVARFEREVAEFLGAAHVVAVSSCTTGLMLALRCLAVRGEAIMPSFTFMATGHAALWNELRPVFVDCDRHSFTVDPDAVKSAVGDATGVIMATHTFGMPCDADRLADIGAEHGIPVVLDAAHAFGSSYADGRHVGSKGTVEVFSLSPTKCLSTGEGGLVATGDAGLADELRVARDYGNPGDYDSRLVGMNGRMQELSAVIGRRGLRFLPEWLERRQELVDRYRSHLSRVPGIAVQDVSDAARAVCKDFSVVIDEEQFGLCRDDLAVMLRAEGVSSRTYFDPPVHRQVTYERFYREEWPLPNTDWLSANILALPLFSHMGTFAVDRVCDAIEMAHDHRREIARALR
jgi:dTDP-4-amino-4,6-dideoxygalactose transaminase